MGDVTWRFTDKLQDFLLPVLCRLVIYNMISSEFLKRLCLFVGGRGRNDGCPGGMGELKPKSKCERVTRMIVEPWAFSLTLIHHRYPVQEQCRQLS